MVAILRTTLPNGESVELGKCAGKGEIYWPFIRLEPHVVATNSSTYTSARDLNVTSARSIFKTGKQRKVSPPHKSSHRSLGKMKQLHDSKFYSIEVTCPSGWPLTLAQWKRVDEVINSIEFTKVEQLQIQKKLAKEKEKPTKIMSAKEKERVMPLNFGVHQPLPGDAFVELECAFAVGGGVVAKRDDERDQNFVNARKAWDAREHGRNARGAQIRKQFREEFLVIPPPEISESTKSGLDSSIRSSNMDTDVMDTLSKDAFEEMENEEQKDLKDSAQGQGPTPATESGKQIPDDNDHNIFYSVIVTSDMAKAAAKERQARIEAAKERMKELQLYNEEHVLGRQKDRCFALEKLFVDANMCPELMDVMEQRETAIQEEVLTRTLSATKKKMDAKKLEVKKTDAKKTEGRKKQ
ncbi:unnamed protein product [Spodoptera exigua]|nr:unnamed protein product [Spodoptera exigua]